MSYENWIEHNLCLQQQAENEMSNAYNLREEMKFAKMKAKQDLEFQQDSANFALRKRAYRTRTVRNGIEWESRKVID